MEKKEWLDMTKEMVSITQDEWEVFKGILDKVNLAVELESEEPKEDESWEDESCECVSCEGESEEVVEIPLEDWEDISEAFHGLQEELKETEEALEEIVKRVEDDKCLDEKLEETLLEDGRIIYLHDEISEDVVNNIVPLIHYFNEVDKGTPVEKRKEITIYINTDGGCVYSSMLISQEIKNSITPIKTVVNGRAYSGGLMIFMASKNRELAEMGQLMYHEARYGTQGTTSQVGRFSENVSRLQKYYDNLVIDGTKVTQEMLDEHKGKISDWFIDKEEALKLGIVTE